MMAAVIPAKGEIAQVKEAPHLEFVSADAVTIPCRAIKSPAEIALAQRAMDITVEAYKEVTNARLDYDELARTVAHAAFGKRLTHRRVLA
jgi:Xaa-Pro aminopeptidase